MNGSPAQLSLTEKQARFEYLSSKLVIQCAIDAILAAEPPTVTEDDIDGLLDDLQNYHDERERIKEFLRAHGVRVEGES
jgi:hypothetical protein